MTKVVSGVLCLFVSGLIARAADPQRIEITAYQVLPAQISGGPGWLDTDRFDIDAKAESGMVSENNLGLDKTQVMLQELLKAQFKLTVHKETKEQAVYALVAAKGEPKLTKSKIDDPWAPLQRVAGAGDKDSGIADPARPSLFVLLEEQLGLKLDAQRGTVETLVIDHAEKISGQN